MSIRPAAVVACAFAIALAGTAPAIAQTDNVKAAIEAANKKFSEAVAAGNAASLAAMYGDGALLMPPNSEPLKGRATIEKFWQGVLTSGVKQAVLTVQDADVHGDTAIETGAYVMKDAASKDLDRGKYIVVWKRIKGQLMIHRDIWNTSLPASSPGK
jgi:ketosteroid isomerase-like protein